MKFLLAVIMIFSTLACTTTPLTEEEQHTRDDALIVEIKQFWLAYDEYNTHGIVVFEGRGLRRIRYHPGGRRPKIDIWTMRAATCMPRQ